MRFLRTFIHLYDRIKTRPTRFFPLMIFAIIGLFLLAYMHNYNIVYLMMFFTFSLAGASSLIGRYNLLDLKLSLMHKERFFADTTSWYTLRLSNPHNTRYSYAIELEAQEYQTILHELPPNHQEVLKIPFHPEKRGHDQLPSIKVGSHFPLPYQILYKMVDLETTVTVYPKPEGEPLRSYLQSVRSYTGEQDDFDGIRTYRQSDPISLIHWPSVAKGTDDMMSKAFVYNDQREVLHFSFEKAGNDDEQRLSQLTLWVLECEKASLPFTIAMPNNQMLDSTTMSHDEILDILADF